MHRRENGENKARNYKKILKLLDVGKHPMAVNILQQVLVVLSRAVVQTY